MKETTRKGAPVNSPKIASLEELTYELEQLRAENAILNNVISNMPGNVYWKGTDGRYMGCNKNMLKTFNLKSVSEFAGKYISEFLSEEDIVELNKYDDEILHQGRPHRDLEENGFDTQGNAAVYLSNKLPLYNHRNEIIGLLGISFDITDRKNMENDLRIARDNAELASRAKTDFIANMSHDIKTPLAGIIGISELLSYRLNNDNGELAETLLASGRQLLSFIENCLEASKIENGDIALEMEHFHLHGIIDEITDLFQPSIKAKQLALNITLDEQLPAFLIGCRSGLYRILLNLVANAVKFTKEGHIGIHLSVGRKTSDREVIIKIVIDDTGIGIAEENQKVIFDRFTRLVPSYKGTYDGSGIGLYLVQSFVQKLGGEIFVHSTLGVGSQFTIVLPFQIPLLSFEEYEESPLVYHSQKTQTNCDIKPDMANFFSCNTPRVLLVEDNPVAQRVTTSLLASLNCEVDVAESGEKALAVFAAEKYDLVLLDIGLPDMQGDEVAAIFRERESTTNTQTPIIALTAHTTPGSSEQYIKNGINHVLSKPLLRREAETLITSLLDND